MADASETLLQAWRDETLRLNHRYMVEVVERFALCPWAKASREAGQVGRRVLLHSDDNSGPAHEALRDFASDPKLEVGLLIFPRLAMERSEFQRFSNRLIEEDRQHWGERSAPFAVAAFHPEVSLDLSNADRLVPFLRCTPDPTLQLIRMTALARVRGDEIKGTQFVDLKNFRIEDLARPKASLRERIAAHNLLTAEAHQPELLAVVQSLLEDHKTTRERLLRLAPLPPHWPNNGEVLACN